MIVARPDRYAMDNWDEEFIKDFSLIQEIVRGIRNIRSEYKDRAGTQAGSCFSLGEFTDITRVPKAGPLRLGWVGRGRNPHIHA